MKTIILDLNYLGECSQEQLDAYKSIGSVRHLRRLRQQEIRRKKLFKRILCVLKLLLWSACILFALWAVASWINIITQNCYSDPVYHAWNFFTIFN